MQAETPSLGFLVAAYIYKRWRTSFVQAKTAVEWENSSRTAGRPRDGVSLSCFADQGPNPT